MRYDGKSKPNHIVLNQLKNHFTFIAICPEVEAGLGTPRPAMQLIGHLQKPKLIQRDNPTQDITNKLKNYCNKKIPQLQQLNGFIFKSRSPSCGLNSTPIYHKQNHSKQTTSGIFAQQLCQHYPQLAVIEDSALNNKKQLEQFIKNTTKTNKS